MANKGLKIVFDKDHSPRKKGEIFVAVTRDEIRTAEWYLSNQIAHVCGCDKKGSGCADCDKKAEVENAPTNFDSMKLSDLKEYADKNNIDSSGNKADLLERIKSEVEK